MVQSQFTRPDLNHIVVQRWSLAILRKNRHLRRLTLSVIEKLHGSTADRCLAVVYLFQVQNLPLHRASASGTPALGDGPITVFFHLFQPLIGTQKHTGSFEKNHPCVNGLDLGYKRMWLLRL
jgi:hypothetical protein